MSVMDDGTARWPEDDVRTAAPKTGRLRRLGRALGDMFLTVGLSKGFTGSDRAGENPEMTNVALFGEGEAKGRAASRGHTHD